MMNLKKIVLVGVAILLIMGPITGITAYDFEDLGSRQTFEKGYGNDEGRELSLAEFYYFIANLPTEPVRVACLDEERKQPHVLAVFGISPKLNTEYDIKKFDKKLLKIVREVPSSVWDCILSNNSLLSDRHYSKANIPVIMTGANQGVIAIGLPNRDLSVAAEVYDVISAKAKNLYEIKDVPVVFSGDVSVGLATWTPFPPYGE